ncbi:hypothetical protein HNP84_000049 [Thermocatellispora tengchongensis]|uniref:Uncharacterized protein n=1 Tax=Thermocatellispora tengchongensis TaxID=1073253 RepID=A0A840NXG8_9ACTN|nr:hypothetical protein [Thermocatellispora tengchongensis]MBB5130361.1 hypothetical protein [Thermocatellispora tengchongensis]
MPSLTVTGGERRVWPGRRAEIMSRRSAGAAHDAADFRFDLAEAVHR